jgi:hypothetical protein
MGVTPNRRLLVAVALGAAVVASCGENSLSTIGDRSRDFVHGSTTTTTEFVVEAEERRIEVVNAVEVEWYNDAIEGQRIGDPGYVAAQVWSRGNGTDRFIQASRVEIAAALPDVAFPELIPADVGWVTSQLVYDTASGTLDSNTSAAFGLWVVEPYSESSGSIAVLRVGRSPEDATTGQSAIIVDPVENGISLSWNEGQYRYELFCRTTVPPDVCEEIARNVAPLRLMLPEDALLPDTPADQEAAEG